MSNIVHLPIKYRQTTCEGETWLCHVPLTNWMRNFNKQLEAAPKLLPAPKEKADE